MRRSRNGGFRRGLKNTRRENGACQTGGRPLADGARPCYVTPLDPPAVPPPERTDHASTPRVPRPPPPGPLRPPRRRFRLQARPRLDGTARRAQGQSHQMPPWTSKIFPGTVRDYWVYVPAQYDGKKPACVMVFQDGGSYVNAKGQFRVPTVFDNLIHKKEMPVTIGIFINPGVVPPPTATRTPSRAATAASSTTRSPTSTPASWRRRSCPRSARTTSCARTPPAGRSAASAPAASAPSPRPGSGPTCSARC